VLEGEAAVTGDVIGVRMGLENADELDLLPFRRIQIRFDRVCRVDDHGEPGLFVADQVRSAPEIVVDKLPEQHVGDGTNECGYIS
jgi:hypothetical protein